MYVKLASKKVTCCHFRQVWSHCLSLPTPSSGSWMVERRDPISVVGMFGFSYLFSIVIDNLSNFRRDQVLPATYADNWEILCGSLRSLLQLLPGIDEFLQTCRLPVAVDKCWGWSLHPADRKVLRTQTRNSRVRTGGKRLVRLAGLPLSFWHRVAVVRKSIWKHFAWLSNCCGTQNSAY